MSSSQATAGASKFGRIGLDLGMSGRIARLLLGTAMVVGVIYDLTMWNRPSMFLVQAAFYFVLSLMVYTVAFYALRESVLARMNPWIGTAILLTPVLVVLMFDLGPPAFQIGINAYVGTSLIVASFMRYGGCEVVAVPSLLFGKRYVVYCPYNVIDVVEKAVLDTILELYRELGHAPPREEVARRSRMAPERVRALLDRLAGRDLVVLEGDQIVGAYPLTDRPTEHRVRVEGQGLHAMCAIDALGVGAMYGTNTLIESRCRLCRVAIDIATVDHGRRLDTVLPAETVVSAGIGYRGGCAATSLCTTIAFFCGDAHLSEWRSAQPLDASGFRLSIDEAFEVGRAVFGAVLAPPALRGQPGPTA